MQPRPLRFNCLIRHTLKLQAQSPNQLRCRRPVLHPPQRLRCMELPALLTRKLARSLPPLSLSLALSLSLCLNVWRILDCLMFRRCQLTLKPSEIGKRRAHVSWLNGYCEIHSLADVVQLRSQLARCFWLQGGYEHDPWAMQTLPHANRESVQTLPHAIFACADFTTVRTGN